MITILLFIGSLAVLLFAGGLAVNSVTRVASALRMGAFTTGIVIMSFATTTPELLVGIDSGLAGQPELSLGNVLGTLIVNLGLILGVLLIRTGSVKLSSQIFRRDLLIVFAAGFLVMLLALDGTLSRLDGGVLLLAFVFWISHLLHERRAFHDIWDQGPAIWGCLGAIGRFGIAILLLLLSADWTVESGLVLAERFQVPTYLIGVLAIAIGTSLPELVFAFRAGPLGKAQFSIGNLIGATTVNATLILGITALLSPITTPVAGLLLLIGTCLFAIGFVTVAPLVLDDGYLRRSTGWVLILIFLTFVTGQLIYGR